MTRMRVVALIAGEPRASELWTLQRLGSEIDYSLAVVQARAQTSVSGLKRASMLTARLLAGRWEEKRTSRLLDELFDGHHLRDWWMRSGIHCVRVPHLNHQEARGAIAGIGPDLIVNLSAGMLQRDISSLASKCTLEIHHARPPCTREMRSIVRGIESRPEWIGAVVRIVGGKIDPGYVLWSGSPQIALGDTHASLFFRAHVGAVEALSDIVHQYASGDGPRPCCCGGSSFKWNSDAA